MNSQVIGAPMPRVHGMAKHAIEQCHLKWVLPADVLAVVKKETTGVTWYCQCNAIDRANLAAAAKITGFSGAVILQSMTIPDGPNKGRIARFRMEPQYWSWAVSKIVATGVMPEAAVILGCSVGLAQQMVRWMVYNRPVSDMVPHALAFAGDEYAQILQCAGSLNQLMERSQGNRRLAYTRYNAGPNINHVSAYGESVYNLFEQVRKMGG